MLSNLNQLTISDELGYWANAARRGQYRIGELARYHGVTVRRLQQHFANRFGRSPKDVVNDIRLKEAKEMLLEAQSAKQVAIELQFCDAAHFSRAFRDRHGVSPSGFLRSSLAMEAEAA